MSKVGCIRLEKENILCANFDQRYIDVGVARRLNHELEYIYQQNHQFQVSILDTRF